MKCILLSCVFQNRKIILKFYEPTTNKIIMVQNTDYKQSCYIKRDEATKLQGMMGINNIQDVDIYDIVKDVTQIKPTENEFDLKNIDMDSVVDTDSFSDQVTKWANLLGQNIPSIRRLAFDIEVEVGDTMPDTSKALQRITAISFHSDDRKQVYTLKRPEVGLMTRKNC